MSEVHMPTEFHRWITNLMEARKISINGLAGLAELDSPALNKALRGRRPVSANVAKKIAPFLGATAAEILLMAEAGKHLVTSPVDTYRAVVSVADHIQGSLMPWVNEARGTYPPDRGEVADLFEAITLGVLNNDFVGNMKIWNLDYDHPDRIRAFDIIREDITKAKADAKVNRSAKVAQPWN